MSPQRAGRSSSRPSRAVAAPPPSTPLRELFGELQSRFERARRAGDGGDLHLRIADRSVAFRFADSALEAALGPPFAHLAERAPDGGAGLTLELWDGATSGLEPPQWPWRTGDIGDLGEIRSSEGAIRAVVDRTYGAVTIVDQARGKALFQAPSAAALPWYERAAPLRVAMHHLLAPTGAMLVHAGAVGGVDGGALLVGRGGSGKSTLAVAAALAGMRFAGDDYVALTTEQGPVAHSVHRTAKLTELSLRLLPELTDRPAPPDPQEKAVIDVGREAPEALVRSLPLTAVVSSRVGARTRWARISAAAALRSLAPSTMLQLPATRGAGLGQMATLARAVPSYELEIGADSRDAVTALGEVLADAG